MPVASAISCVPSDLVSAAKCFCIPQQDVQASVIIYLLAQIAGSTANPSELVANAKCYCFPSEETREAVMISLLCSIVNADTA